MKKLKSDPAFAVASDLQRIRKHLIQIHNITLSALEQLEHGDAFKHIPQVGFHLHDLGELSQSAEALNHHMLGVMLGAATVNPFKAKMNPASEAFLREMITGKKPVKEKPRKKR